MSRYCFLLAISVFFLEILTPIPVALAQNPDKTDWSATGTLFESCTCAVPCSCNFGEPPSPHHYCYAVYAYQLKTARYAGVDLSGLIIGGANGPDGDVAFLDARATATQRPVLQKLARSVFAQGGAANGAKMPFRVVTMVPAQTDRKLSLRLGDFGGFTAQVIVGRDGKTPVIVENNTIWPIPRAIKAKTSQLRFQSSDTGMISETGSNANYGAFSLGGPIDTPVARTNSCCASKNK